MNNKLKEGIDYWKHFNTILSETNLIVMFNKYNSTLPHTIFCYLMDEISKYNDNNYKLTKEKKYVAMSKLQFNDLALFDNIVSDLVNYNFFDKKKYKKGIITNTEMEQTKKQVFEMRKSARDRMKEKHDGKIRENFNKFLIKEGDESSFYSNSNNQVKFNKSNNTIFLELEEKIKRLENKDLNQNQKRKVHELIEKFGVKKVDQKCDECLCLGKKVNFNYFLKKFEGLRCENELPNL